MVHIGLKILEGPAIENSSYKDNIPEILQIDLKTANINISGDSIENLNISLDNIIIELEEKNVISKKENFEITFFEVNGDSLTQIDFGEKKNNVKDGILLEEELDFNIPENDITKAEYYFKFIRDKKINENKINNLKNKLKNIYI